jgi:hypothetical protein
MKSEIRIERKLGGTVGMKGSRLDNRRLSSMAFDVDPILLCEGC